MSELNKKMMGTPDLNEERLSELKRLLPDIFTVEGRLNPAELQKIISPEAIKESERFEFKWFGKSGAKRTAFTPSKATLVFDQERSVNPDAADGNMIIEGENLETLKCLLCAYREKIKCIYIDPPYNTGSDFVYSDKWDDTREDYWEHIGVTQNGVKMDTNTESSGRYHSNWLNMIYPRLLLARQLLCNDGVIFISIDDHEVHHLRKICDEVFGEDNFAAQIVWQRAFSPINLKKHFSESHDYIVCFFKNSDLFELHRLSRSENSLNRYQNPDSDPRGVWASGGLDVGPPVQEKIYPIKTPSGRIVNPPSGYCWRYKKAKFEELILDNRIWFGEKGDNVPRIKRFLSEVKEGVTPMTLWLREEVGDSQSASREVKKIFNDKAFFDYPKPVDLLKRCISLCTNPNDIVLDFFAGSGTTAHAVMELNKEDGGNRKFILVQIPEITEESSEAYRAGYKKISDITIERNKRVIERMSSQENNNIEDISLNDAPTDLFRDSDTNTDKALNENGNFTNPGFKVYRLAKSNFPRVDFVIEPDKSEEENLDLLQKYIAEKESALDRMLYENEILDEVLLKNGFMLNYKKEQETKITKNKVFRINDSYKECLICIDSKIEEKTVGECQEFCEKIFICLERALDTTIKWNMRNLFKDKLIAF